MPIEPRTVQTAVVTGPTGAVGTALCAHLTRQGVDVYAVVRPDSHRASHLERMGGVTVVYCDMASLADLPDAIPAADAFFHLAWGGTAGAGRNDMDVQFRNIQYTLDACRAAKALGCAVFVGAGSQAEYGRVDHALAPDTPCFPENGYGIAKLCAGQMSRIECDKLGVAHVWSRILSVYGPWDGESALVIQAIRALLRGEKPALTAGAQIWDYLYVDDAADGLYRMALCGRDGAIYPLGSGQPRPLRAYVEALRDAIDPTLPLGFGEIAYGEKQVMHLEADISALTADTGFTPKIDFQMGIERTLEYVRNL